MMRTVTWMLAAAMLVAVAPVAAQEQAPEPQEEAVDFQRMAASQDLFEKMQMFKEMGMREEQALFFSILTSGKMDPATMMLLMAMMDGGRMDGDAVGMMLMMNAMGGKQGATQPVVLDKDGYLLIVEDGVLYKINLEEMALEGSVPYAGAAQGGEATMALLAPVIQRAREKALQASCLSNMKQLCLGMLMYAQDWDEVLPGETWAKDIYPYIKNEQVFVCPSRPDLPVGYAMNEKLLLAKLAEIPRVGETALIFESNVGGENPVGGADDVPEEGVHNGGINVGFVDGHCKWMTVEAARDLLEQEPF